jgi:hypothetical protein
VSVWDTEMHAYLLVADRRPEKKKENAPPMRYTGTSLHKNGKILPLSSRRRDNQANGSIGITQFTCAAIHIRPNSIGDNCLNFPLKLDTALKYLCARLFYKFFVRCVRQGRFSPWILPVKARACTTTWFLIGTQTLL